MFSLIVSATALVVDISTIVDILPSMESATLTDTARTARLFQALSDETRLEIIALLVDGERCVCDLTDTLDAAQSRLSFHLRVLKDAGLVTDRRDGRWSYYKLDREVFDELEALLKELKPSTRRQNQRSIRCCD